MPCSLRLPNLAILQHHADALLQSLEETPWRRTSRYRRGLQPRARAVHHELHPRLSHVGARRRGAVPRPFVHGRQTPSDLVRRMLDPDPSIRLTAHGEVGPGASVAQEHGRGAQRVPG